MEGLLRAPSGGRIFTAMAVFGMVVFGIATGVLMAPHAPALGDRMAELTCLQLAFTPERAASVVLSFAPDAQAAIARLLVPGDVTFAWGYGFLFAGLLGLLTRRLDGAWFRAGVIVVWFPLAASLFDCIEDLFLLSIVNQLIAAPEAGLSPVITALAGISAVFKYVALSVVSPAFALVGSAVAIRSERSLGAWVTYILVSLLAISMVLRPVQQIPACF